MNKISNIKNASLQFQRKFFKNLMNETTNTKWKTNLKGSET